LRTGGAGCPSCSPTNSNKALKDHADRVTINNINRRNKEVFGSTQAATKAWIPMNMRKTANISPIGK